MTFHTRAGAEAAKQDLQVNKELMKKKLNLNIFNLFVHSNRNYWNFVNSVEIYKRK